MLSWFLTSRFAQGIGAALLVLAAVGVALLKAFAAGQAKERLASAEERIATSKANLDAVRDRKRVEEEVRRRSLEENRKRLKEWGRK
ncbi:hypothetical protein [Microvirga yunnanensis]|uniref:hypothetical protein n=1 Tax=Microvirga yunnanensis TaxID=2953740 RepID=UPI0021C60616|nr:hypothetical protein [Microvirga sp. HBU67655]